MQHASPSAFAGHPSQARTVWCYARGAAHLFERRALLASADADWSSIGCRLSCASRGMRCFAAAVPACAPEAHCGLLRHCHSCKRRGRPLGGGAGREACSSARWCGAPRITNWRTLVKSLKELTYVGSSASAASSSALCSCARFRVCVLQHFKPLHCWLTSRLVCSVSGRAGVRGDGVIAWHWQGDCPGARRRRGAGAHSPHHRCMFTPSVHRAPLFAPQLSA